MNKLFIRSVITVVMMQAICACAMAQELSESTLRTALKVSQYHQCDGSSDRFRLVAMQPTDESGTLTSAQVESVSQAYLNELRDLLPSCVRLSEISDLLTTSELSSEFRSGNQGTSDAFDPITFVRNRLSDANAYLQINITREASNYIATTNIVEFEDGFKISSETHSIPKQLTDQSCSNNYVSEQVGLSGVASEVIDKLYPINIFSVNDGVDTELGASTPYGQYIASRFKEVLSAEGTNDLLGRSVVIADAVGAEELAPNVATIQIHYWLCDGQSALLQITANTIEQNTVTHLISIDISSLPDSINPVANTANQQSEAAIEIWLGDVSVMPKEVATGELLEIISIVPSGCKPFFFDISSAGKLTNIPLSILDVEQLENQTIRYSNTADSKYGIVVQPEDERGIHSLGYLCEPVDLEAERLREVLRMLMLNLDTNPSGIIELGTLKIRYETTSYRIKI